MQGGSETDMGAADYARDLGGGLGLRWSEARDAEGIAELCGYVFRQKAEDPPNRRFMSWVHDMMSGRHPHIGPGDYAVVEETSSRRILSAACLLSHEIELEGIRLPFGRPETVLTHPDYRNRGLVRALFELLHARSSARGHLVQGITGIPYYYRLFGYEYAADLGGELSVYFAAIPPRAGGDGEPYTLRTATEAELPLARELYDQDRARYALSTPIDEAYWRWVATGQNPLSGEGWTTRLILDAGGAVAGYVMTGTRRDADEIKVCGLGVRAGVSLAAVLPPVLRALEGVSGEPLARKTELAPTRVCFLLWRDHPVYHVLTQEQIARRARPYAWYLRVPDLRALLLRMCPIFERRLASSGVAGFSGDLRLSFYPQGLRLLFEGGRLSSVEDWREDHAWGPRAQAGFPSLVFLKLLFGHRSLSDLKDAFPDVFADEQARPVLEALFPPLPSWLLPLD